MANNSTYQYEPLPVPSHWSREERQFAQRLTDVLDDIYLKWGRISEKELSGSLRKKIDSKVDGSQLESYSTIEQTADKIGAAVSAIRVGGRNLLLNTSNALSAYAAGSMGSYARVASIPLVGEETQLHFDYAITGGGSATLTATAGASVFTFDLEGSSGHIWSPVAFTDDDWTRMEFSISGADNQVTISRVQLEKGTTPTDWGQADGELIAGSNVEITQDNVRISTPSFSVGYGGDEYMALDMNGGFFPRLRSPQVAPMYDGPNVLHVNSGTVDGKTYFASINDALDMVNNRFLPYNVEIRVTAYTEYEPVQIYGVCGSGQLFIVGGGMTVNGLIYMGGCTTVVGIANMKAASAQEAGWITNCAYALVNGCQLTTTSTSVEVLKITGGSTARVVDTSLMGGNYSIRAWYASHVSVYNCSGNKNLCVHASMLYGSGTLPCSQTSSLVYTYFEQGYARINGSVSQSGSASTPQTTTSGTYLAKNTGYYQSVWNYGSGYFYQGVTSPYGAITGCMWFDLSALKGKTVTAAKLRLTRVSGYGANEAVDVRLMGLGSGCTGVNTSFSRTKDYGVIGAIPPGATKNFTIPVSAVQDLINGTTGGLCLYAKDTAVQTGLNYSVNYARFYGTAGNDETKPRLSITV